MENELLVQMLEHKIVRHCSPTLLNIKPANLFTFCYDFCTKERAFASTKGGGIVCHEAPIMLSRIPTEGEFEAALRTCAAKLVTRGVYLTVLAHCANGPLVYVYRPAALRRCLTNPQAIALLAREGYRTDSLGSCLDSLSQRLRSSLPNRGGLCEFPHEIGLFLGYPIEDVLGFIAHEGHDYLCLGCWKVYHDVQGARRMWARYEASTIQCQEMIAEGMAIEDIAVSSSFVGATDVLPVAM